MKKITSCLILLWLIAAPMVQAQSPATGQDALSEAELYEYVKSVYADTEVGLNVTPEELEELIQNEINAYKSSGETPEQFFYPTDDDFDEEDLGSDIYTNEFGNTSCFDHYVFGSVQARLYTETEYAVPGTKVVFQGTLENENPYPLAEGTLYVRLFKNPDPETDYDITGNGPEVVDQFVAIEDISLPANGSIPVEFSWPIPTSAVSGDYELATFFSTSNRYNLLGLSFTDDVTGNTVPFFIESENDSRVHFDKSSVTVNNEPYFFAAFPPRITPEEEVTVSATLVNDTDETVEVPVTYTQYEWDALRQKNRVSIDHKVVTVPANSSIAVSYNSALADYPVYLLEIRADWKKSKSLLNVRYARESVDVPRINFPSMSAFPIEAGEPNYIFTCLHNVGESMIPVTLKLTLSDQDGNVISSLEESGDLSPQMAAVKKEFTTNRGYDFLVLDAELYHDDELVETERVVYDCNDFGSDTCLANADKQAPVPEESQNGSQLVWWVALFAVAVVFILIVTVGLKLVRGKAKPEDTDNVTPNY